MSLSHGILGFLSYGNMTGYDLAKVFNSSVNFFWCAQNSHIYLELNKLEKQGYVSCEHIIQSDKPNKKLYHITESGKEEFLNWLSKDSSETVEKNKNAFLLKLFFSGEMKPEESIKILKKFIDDCQKYADRMSSIPENISKNRDGIEDYKILYWEMTAQFGNRYINLCIEWAKRCIHKLEEYK